MIGKSLRICFLSSLFLSTQAFAYLSYDLPSELMIDPIVSHGKSICDNQDDRLPSYKQPIGRVLAVGAPAGCTLTMIGSSCAVSAGHCRSTFEEVHFNTPLSRNGEIQFPRDEDIYYVDTESIEYVFRGIGQDWAVLRIEPNELTGSYPGDVQGYLEMAEFMPQEESIVRITGYGTARGEDVNFAQQTHTGPITGIDASRTTIRHRADTTGGNSGSSVVDEETGLIIGIHTHGGCWGRSGANASTLYAENEAMQEAVKACLNWEEENL